MSNLTDIFSNREIALFFWIIVIIFISTLSKNTRDSMAGVIKILFSKRIISVFSLLTIYVGLIVFSLNSISLWNWSLFKDTVFWHFSFAVVTFFNITKVESFGFFKTILIDCFKWTIFIEFLVNFYTFNLMVEIILFPFVVFISLIYAFSQTDKKNEPASKFFYGILLLIGTTYLAYAIYKTVIDYQSVFNFQSFNSLILPILLTLMVLPFFYFLAVYMQYEVIYIRAQFFTNDEIKQKELKRQIFVSAKLNLNKIRLIGKNINKFDLYHSGDIKKYIKSIVSNHI